MGKFNEAELMRRHKILCSHPVQYLAMVDGEIMANPDDSHAYFNRCQVLSKMGHHEEALKAINKKISLDPSFVAYKRRGSVLMALERYPEALASFNEAEKRDSDLWKGCLGPLFRADCYARMGNEQAAIADAMKLSDTGLVSGA